MSTADWLGLICVVALFSGALWLEFGAKGDPE